MHWFFSSSFCMLQVIEAYPPTNHGVMTNLLAGARVHRFDGAHGFIELASSSRVHGGWSEVWLPACQPGGATNRARQRWHDPRGTIVHHTFARSVSPLNWTASRHRHISRQMNFISTELNRFTSLNPLVARDLAMECLTTGSYDEFENTLGGCYSLLSPQGHEFSFLIFACRIYPTRNAICLQKLN
jgi:hypothetical protein